MNAQLQENMKNPNVSVLMSVYNGEKHLREAIDSILNQTFTDFELLIINDASTDRTVEILQNYHDPRIKIINNEKNMGLTKSLNKGISLAKGNYIARQDADDISLQDRFKKQLLFLEENPDIGLVGSSFNIINTLGDVTGYLRHRTEDRDIRNHLLEANQFCHGSVMFRRETIKAVGAYREYFRYAQDYDMWLRISEKFKLGNIQEILYLWRDRDESLKNRTLTAQFKYAAVAVEQAIKRKGDSIDDIEKGLSPKLPDCRSLPEQFRKPLLEHFRGKFGGAIKKREIITALSSCFNYIYVRYF